jgi:excisionase family DNA binding protein
VTGGADVQRVVVVHGVGDDALDAALRSAGLTPAICLESLTVWLAHGPEPTATPGACPPPYPAGPERLLLSVGQAAAVLGVGRTTAYQLIQHGELEVIHVGRSARVPAESLPELVGRLRNRRPGDRGNVSRPGGRIRAVGYSDHSQPPAAETV